MANDRLDPSQQEIISDAIDARMHDLHTCLPGRIVSYDAAKQVADVKPMVKRAIPDTAGKVVHEAYPVLPNVPVVWQRSGGFMLHFPLAAGDSVLLVFSEAATAQWRESGSLSEAGDITRHGLSYAFAIPGIAPNAQALAPTGANMVAPTPFSVGNAASAKFLAWAETVDANIAAIKSWLAAHTHPVAGAVAGVSALPPPVTTGTACAKLKAE
jgi:hypothetical protein